MTKNDTKELTPKQQAFIDALFSEECKGDRYLAKIAAGYSPSTTYHDIISDSVAEAIVQRQHEMVKLTGAKAVFALADVLDSPTTPGNKERIQAANSILDRAGVVKSSEVTHKGDGMQIGLVILPPKNSPTSIED